MKTLKLAIATTTLALATPIQAHAYATLISCHDGDTCRFNDGGQTVNVRFAGIDAPEAKQTGGKDARKYLLTLLTNKKVDLKCDGTKSYKRKVCAVYVEGRDIAGEMVKAGWAWDYEHYSHGKYAKLMHEAQSAKAGIWKSGIAITNPRDFRQKKRSH